MSSWSQGNRKNCCQLRPAPIPPTPAPQTSIYYLFKNISASRASNLCSWARGAQTQLLSPWVWDRLYPPPRGSLCVCVCVFSSLWPGVGWGNLEPQMLGCRGGGREHNNSGHRHQPWCKHRCVSEVLGSGLLTSRQAPTFRKLSPQAANTGHSSEPGPQARPVFHPLRIWGGTPSWSLIICCSGEDSINYGKDLGVSRGNDLWLR